MTRLFAVLAAGALLAHGQALKQQLSETAIPRGMTTAELSVLNDPLFRLVLKTKPNEARFDEVVRLIKGAAGTEQVFVVDERIVDSARQEAIRRVVVGFKGNNQGVLDTNVMLSAALTPDSVRPGFIEGWGWDDARGRYNYYRLDKKGGALSWKFRGSSLDADNLTAAQRDGTCMACHLNGGPVMKELPIPWNNWFSFRSQPEYLTTGGANHWPIAEGPHLAVLLGAEDLEISFILPALRQFNGRRIQRLIKSNSPGGAPITTAGKQQITDGKRALRPLFETTEYNITSSSNFSGLHPLGDTGTGPPEDIIVPDTYFLNANLMAGGGVPGYSGIDVPRARSFGSLLVLTPAEYSGLIAAAGIKLGGKPGDNNFAWFVPDTSHSDNHMVDRLIARGVVTKQFVAAALAVDIENPVFSVKRAGLLKFIPATFRFKPRVDESVPAAHPDELTTTVIAALQATSPTAGSAEADFLALLKDSDPVKQLRLRVEKYLTREQAALQDAATRQAEIKRLFDIVIVRRKEARTNPRFAPLNEADGLLFAMP